MQKLNIFLLLFWTISLSAKEFSLNDYNDLANPTIQHSYEQLKYLFSPKQQQFIDKQFKILEKSQEQVITFFYLTSSHLKSIGIKRFTSEIKRLREKFNVEGIVVLRGFRQEESFQKFAERAYKKGDPFRLKIHPMIFKEFKLDRVPAYAVSICNKGEYFSFKRCKNLYLAKGDASLEIFLKEISKRDKRFQKWYEEFIELK